MLGIASETYSCAASHIQHAAITAYSDNTLMKQYAKYQRIILSAIGSCIYKALMNTGLNAHPPEGGFYILLNFTPFQQRLRDIGISKDTEICARVLEDSGVALLPGISFGLPA